ncbi:MAG: iron-sulfur cluster assembly scaffold protein [Betaproteobacteria bacterium]|jgi:nitrogen fixation NifU-like protein|nr:iron-sulfur cluster assembly scaffold protein [Betaproteobacteria bacterium]
MNDDLYQKALLDLAKAAHGAGSLPSPDGTALRDSPLCGDRVRMQVALENGRIKAIAHEVKGCLLCRAAASLVGLHGIGLDAAQAEALRGQVATTLAGSPPPSGWPELALFEPVRPHRNRHGCVLLPFEALAAATHEAD